MKLFSTTSLLASLFGVSSLQAFSSVERDKERFQVEVSGIYWQTKLWGMEFAGKSLLPTYAGPDRIQFSQKVIVPDFAFRPGFKLEVGHGVPLDGMKVEGRWTYLYSKVTNLKKHLHKKIVPTGEGMVPLWYESLGTPRSSDEPLHFWKASNNWKLNFNAFDLELQRPFFPIPSMVVNAFAGLKGSYILQQEHVNYTDGPDFYVSGVNYERARVVMHSDAVGIGPRAGFDSKWAIGSGFSIVADAAFSILYSAVGLGTKNQNLFSDSSYNQTSHMREHVQELVPVLEGILGFDWGMWFSSYSYYLGAMIAYEVQYWWSQNHFRRQFAYNAPANMWDMRGDLQLRGLTASLRSEF